MSQVAQPDGQVTVSVLEMSYRCVAAAGAELPVSKGWTVMVTLRFKVTNLS